MKPKTNTETTVGIFLLLGIGVICTLILFFGEVRDIFKPTYSLTVTFPNASGLLKGSDVFLSGAHIGKVTTDPVPIPDTENVQVNLKIDSRVPIREDAKYVIGSSGLLGDLFVDVKPKEYPPGTPDSDKAAYVKDGETKTGSATVGLDELAQGAQPLLKKANDIADKLDDMMTKLNDQVLTGTSTDDLKETISKLREMVDNGDSMVKNANDILGQAKNSKGALGRLLNDKETGDNLAKFIANLKAHGPIFYKDDTAAQPDDGSKKKK
jgi:ABC-type transporter Mla subunit MlaD